MGDYREVAVDLLDLDQGGTSPASLLLHFGDADAVERLPAFADDPAGAVEVYDTTSEEPMVVIRRNAKDRLLAAVLPSAF